MTLTNGKKISSKDWKGKVVMLQFTASWSGVLSQGDAIYRKRYLDEAQAQ